MIIIWLFEYPWVENTDSCHVFTLIPLRLLSNVKCLSITLAPFATAPKVGMKPSSWPEYPIWISGKFLRYSSSTFKCTSLESILRESSWYYFIQKRGNHKQHINVQKKEEKRKSDEPKWILEQYINFDRIWILINNRLSKL